MMEPKKRKSRKNSSDQAIPPLASLAPVEAVDVSIPLKQWERLIAEVGTGLWRMKQKMVRSDTGEPLDEMRRASRHLEAIWDALTDASVEIHGYTQTPFDPGMTLKVIASEPTPGLERERIIETIKPAIYFRGQLIQIAEVIVGTPEIAE